MWRPEDEAEEEEFRNWDEDDVEEEEEEEVTSSPTPLARKGSTDARPPDDDDDDDEAPATSPPLAPRLPPKIGSTGPAFGRNDGRVPKDDGGACAACCCCCCGSSSCACDCNGSFWRGGHARACIAFAKFDSMSGDTEPAEEAREEDTEAEEPMPPQYVVRPPLELFFGGAPPG